MKKLYSILFAAFLLQLNIFAQSGLFRQNPQAQISMQKNYPAHSPGHTDKTLSYLAEDFEDEKFPPPGWSLEFTGVQHWMRFQGASAYGVGLASAVFYFYSALAGQTQSMVLSSMGASIPGDSLRFDHAYATFMVENDQLIIETSTNGGTTYSMLVTLNGGTSGPLVTAPPTGDIIFEPTSTQWKTKSFALPVGTNRVRFKAISAFGNNLYIDNCTIGSQSDTDVGTQSIDIPNPLAIWTWIPKVTVENHSPTPQTFSVTLMISPDGYSSIRTVTALPGDTKSTVLFDSWTPTLGTHNVTAFTTLAGDMDPSNDTLHSSVLVNGTRQVANISVLPKDGQVFITWENLTMSKVVYTLYKSSNPIRYGYQLSSAQNMGNVRDNSALNERLTQLSGGTPKYLKIDSASPPLAANKGLFVATSTVSGSFYYAVTANAGEAEDTTIVVGSNALTSPVSEDVLMPQPVRQESRIIGGRTFDIYVQFATKVTSSVYPQMTNASSFPFHFAIIKSGSVTPHPLTICLHWGYGNFLEVGSSQGIGAPNEWIITVDDWIPNIEYYTCFYGYHEDYDIQSNHNTVPVTGILYNYTSARIIHTLDWSIKNLPVDSTRTYMTGTSAGAIGTLLNSLVIPAKIAAIFVYAPRIDMSNFGWWPTQWGTQATNLITNEGYSKNERLNVTYLAYLHESGYLPIMYTFCGKNDVNVGWYEKPSFYNSLNGYRHGGFHFWSMTDHYQTSVSSPWQPNFPNFSFFTRYRTNLSYPGFSNCLINDNPGNGTPSNGDPIGSINGHLDWNDNIVDLTNRWEITLRLKDLSTTTGLDISPDSATTDVTLRRLQAFSVPAGSLINWENRRSNVVVQQGFVPYDSGLITIPSVRVYRDSSRLSVTYVPVSVDEKKGSPVEFALLQNYPNPFNPGTIIKYSLPEQSYVTLKVYDILGREAKILISEELQGGNYEVEFNGADLSSGVYFYQLKAGNFTATRKLLLLK